MVIMTAPSITESPWLTVMLVTVPAYSDSMLFCIFMASSTMTMSPTATVSPTLTLMALMVPGRGALTALPAPAGAAAGLTGAAATGAAATGAAGAGTAIKAPLPGTINAINVKVGDKVGIGDVVIVLEAMKMQNNIEAETAGTVTSVLVNQGDTVMEGAVMLTIG